MNPSIEQARCDVHEAFAAAVACADNGRSRSLWAVERELWTRLLALGRALVVLFLARQVARPRATAYVWRGVRYVLADWRTTELGTRFGKVSFARPVGRRPTARKVAADLPVDRELGLGSRFSLGVVLGIARLCAQMSFASARETYRDVYEWAPSPRAAMRMVDALGDRARPFLEQAPPPEDDGEILVCQVDAGGAPMISAIEYERRRQPKSKKRLTRKERKRRRRENLQPRRTKGKKSKNSKMAVAAVIYTLRRGADGLEGPINKRVLATFESHEALFIWLRQEADKRGYGQKKTLFLADGSEHIWRLQKKYLPKAECCLDWYHLMEYVWKAGRCFYREGSKALRQWVCKQVKRLRSGRIDEVIDELKARLEATPKTGPGNKGRRERLEQTIGYIDKNKARMPYASFLERELDIGSGAIEGAIRNLIRMRLDGPGMRWGRRRSERILHLRCILLNGQWDEFSDHLVLGEPVTLPAQPERTVPHDAKAVA